MSEVSYCSTVGSRWSWVVLVIVCLVSGCSKNPASPSNNQTPQHPPGDYPPIPKPSSPLDLDVPMQSETLSVVVPILDKKVDFVPVISDGVFLWDIDIQTQYIQECLVGCPQGTTELYLSATPGDYANGVIRFSQMIFENGAVNLTHLNPFWESNNTNASTQRIVFVQKGVKVQPRSPYRNDCWFDWWGNTPAKQVTPCLFGGYVNVPVPLGFLDKARWREYYVAAKSCDTLTTPVYIRRDRFWTRVLIDGKKSIRVDPGNTFTVTYERTQGVSSTESQQFARTLDLGLGAGYSGVTASLGATLSATFSTEINVSEQTTVSTSRTVTGIDGKTVIYSVWRSVEHYTVTDSLGNPYTDPNFGFSDLGQSNIQGEYEWLSSAIFDL